MEKRLELANKLLKNTGIILMNIDENEFAQLKLL
jgi:adenine specific DNA methylase Mod